MRYIQIVEVDDGVYEENFKPVAAFETLEDAEDYCDQVPFNTQIRSVLFIPETELAKEARDYLCHGKE